MHNKKKILEIRENIFKGLEESYKRLIESKKKQNSTLIISRNGKIVEVDPLDMPPTIQIHRKNIEE